MAYADTIRTATATMSDVATLIEGVFASTYPLTWTSYSPTYSASGSMTYTSVSTTMAKYVQVGKLVIVKIDASGTTGGSASNTLIVSLPVASVSANHWQGGYTVDGGNNLAAVIAVNNSGINVSRYDGANYGLGGTRKVGCVAIYEAS